MFVSLNVLYKIQINGGFMRQINIENDIRSLSEFRANASNFLKQVRETKRPLVLTQHGKSTAVLVDVKEYQALIEKLELLEEVQLAEKQVEEGKYLTNDQVEQRLTAKYRE